MSVGDPTLGDQVLRQFRDGLGEAELVETLASFGPEDAASRVLREVTGGSPDLAVASHRRALLAWLRAWGCRHLRVSDTGRSSRALAWWWRARASSLPADDRSLVDLTPDELEGVRGAYAALASLVVAGRASALGEVRVTVGETAAAKALHALRPRAFPPWDEPIRSAFGGPSADGATYRRYLDACAEALRGCAMRLGTDVDDLPSRLGRPWATPARLIDEFLWLRITRDRR